MNSEPKQLYIDFEAYERVSEPDKREKASAWRAAIGLQDVDGLQVSEYLKESAVKHIEGEITIDDVRNQLRSYYATKSNCNNDDSSTEEADKVAANIAKILGERSFSLSPQEVINIHRHLFEGVFKHAGEVRKYDISKKEWVLRGDSVTYGRAEDIYQVLRYDIEQEQLFDYAGLSIEEIIKHIAFFTSQLWQNHPFREGNTRTTAVFVIKYLRFCGFEVDNNLFADNSWYFRNALVRANYQNLMKGIKRDDSFLIRFFRNLLLGDKHELKNRYMLVAELDSTHTSTRISEVKDTHISTRSSILLPKSDNIRKLIAALGPRELSVKEMMEAVGLKNRANFYEYTLSPAIDESFVRLKFPESPRHPKQRYLLTVKGLMVYNELQHGKGN